MEPKSGVDPLKRQIIYIKHPIEIGDDWAIGLTKTKTILYSRYPFGGKQQKIVMRGDIRKWSNRKWATFLAKVKKFDKFSPDLIRSVSKLRVKL